MAIRKMIIVSALVATNIIVWYEVFGVGFLVVLSLVVVIFVLFRRGK